MSKKKKMSNGAFLGTWIPFLTLSVAGIVAVEICAVQFKSILDTYVNKGAMHIDQAEGTENWDTDYYSQTYSTASAAGGNTSAKANGEKTVEEIGNEGMVLLKNDGTLPLTNKSVTLLGRGSVDPVYGGSGSGNVDTTTCATPKSGLEKAGFTVNADAYNFFNSNYKDYDRQKIVMDNYDGSTFFIGEIPTSKYTFTPKQSDTALVFLSRCGGEGLDLSTDLKRDSSATTASKDAIAKNPNTAAEVANYTDGQHQLELSKEEKDMIRFAKTNYSKVVVVLNESTTMEIGDLKNDSKISGIIWAGSPGATGFNSLGSILAGTVNPSGRTPDLYSADFTTDPTFANFAINSVNEYTGIDESTIPGGANGVKSSHFVEYEEGIYVGYRYYETRYGSDESAYNSHVVYPFGYGLSYTTFRKEITDHRMVNDNIVIDVKVTNTGSVAGKEVVEAYFTAPYTKGGMAKSSTVFGDFAKTKLLAPQESETVTLQIAKDDLASYDYKNEKCYVLDQGSYTFQIKNNSHEVAKDSSGKNLEFTLDFNKEIYKGDNKRDGDKVAATNQFDDLNEMFKSTKTTGYATELSRDDWEGTFPSAATAADADASKITIGGETIANRLKTYDVSAHNNKDDKAPTTGASNGLSTIDMRGLDYDDEAYDKLLDQLTEADYSGADNFLNNNAYKVQAIDSVGLPDIECHDGPQGFSTLMGKLNNVCAYMSEPLLAATYNKELAKKMGTSMGEEALAMNPRYAGWWGPAMNTHRSPFAGRNFEYYSEDGVLAGKIASEVISGAADKGLIAFMKHYCANDQETWRTAHLCTWMTEQALREIYLKPFEIVAKTAKTTIKYISDSNGTVATKEMPACTGVMSSFNYVGTTWSGGNDALMGTVLRDEFGFRGVVISDFNIYQYMDANQGLRAGTDLQHTWASIASTHLDTSSATGRIAIRNAVHNLVYTFANSGAMQNVAPGSIVWYEMSPWRIWLICLDVVLGLFFAGGTAWVVSRTINYNKHKHDEDATAEPKKEN